MLLLLLLHWPLLGPRRGQGRRRTFVWALLRARNLTWYLKVSFGIRLEARVMICPITPFYSGHWEGYFSWGVGAFIVHVDYRTRPLETLLSPLGGRGESHLHCDVLPWMQRTWRWKQAAGAQLSSSASSWA